MSLGSYLWSDSQKNISPMNFKAKTTISQNYLRCAASCALCNFSALPTKQAEKVWEYQGAGVGMRFLFALLRPHTRYYAVHAMADLTSQSPIPSFQNRRNWASFVKSSACLSDPLLPSEQCFGAGPFLDRLRFSLFTWSRPKMDLVSASKQLFRKCNLTQCFLSFPFLRQYGSWKKSSQSPTNLLREGKKGLWVNMAVLHRALFTWFICLMFLILVVLRLDQRVRWVTQLTTTHRWASASFSSFWWSSIWTREWG